MITMGILPLPFGLASLMQICFPANCPWAAPSKLLCQLAHKFQILHAICGLGGSRHGALGLPLQLLRQALGQLQGCFQLFEMSLF